MLVWLLITSVTSFGGSATWNLNPASGRWFMASNWTPATIPFGPGDTATFAASNITNVDLEEGTFEVNAIIFNAGASPFTITAISFGSFPSTFLISGVGISNNSAIIQNFVAKGGYGFGPPGVIQFTNSATAGDLTVFTTTSDPDTAGRIEFFDSSSAAHGTFINNGSGNSTEFFDTSTANNAILIANDGGVISLQNDSTGGQARVKVFGNGTLDISAHNAPGVTIGPLEGDGLVLLGANNLTVGTKNRNKTFSGTIQDSGAGGSLTKVERGSLILTNANTYSGGTTISGGELLVDNRTGSATGSGAVQVDVGRLGGTGIIAGPVTIGRGRGVFAELSPGKKGLKPGTLRFLSTLTFNLEGVYPFELDSDIAIGDQVIANGVTIRSHAHFFATDLGHDLWSTAELYDSSNGTWRATGSLANARDSHTATSLPDGMVLVAGGFGATGVLASAELYDFANGTWSETGSLADARIFFTATSLLNGKVLIAGGQGSNFLFLGSAELYDPANRTWSATASLITARGGPTATLLSSGKVLVAGGYDFHELASAELYDPATGIWGTTGSLIAPHNLHTATLLSSGKVLVAGGRDSNYFQLASAELYNPITGTWSAARRLATARDSHTATLLPNGEVLVAGGFGGNASAELYDPATGTWTATGSLITARGGHTATLLPNGKVLAAAGFSVNYPYPCLSSAELYDPATGTWATANNLAHVRSGHTATLLPNGNVLVAGGFGAGIIPIGTVFTAIDNTSATPISGTFVNLADGSTFTTGRNTFQANYEGGDGNDLTLTVVTP